MKIIVPISFLLIGLVGGFFIGSSQKTNTEEGDIFSPVPSIEQVIHDTIFQTKFIEIPVETKNKKKNDIDSFKIDDVGKLNLELDTLKEKMISKPKDSLQNESYGISKDELLAIKYLPIIYLDKKSIDTDSLMKDALSITTLEREGLSIEFWNSPIDYHGYKLSLSKLIIYGVSPQLNYDLYKKNSLYYLTNENVCFQLKENSEFSTYIQVDSKILIND
jgi:hypothetical protein